MSELEKTIVQIIDKILFHVGVIANVDVFKDASEENSFQVALSGSELGMIIGYHGEGLSALQTISSLILAKKTGSWYHLSVDVNGYKKEREMKVREMVLKAMDRVRFSQRPYELPPMMAYERRLAHMEASKTSDVESESVGEGFNRRVVIKPKAAQ